VFTSTDPGLGLSDARNGQSSEISEARAIAPMTIPASHFGNAVGSLPPSVAVAVVGLVPAVRLDWAADHRERAVLARDIVGIGLGQAVPGVFHALGAATLAQVNLPVAVLVWLMIVPMLLKSTLPRSDRCEITGAGS